MMFSSRVEMQPKSLVNRVLLRVLLGLALCTPEGSSQNVSGIEVQCSGGICVPFYLCRNGTVNTSGDGLIDTRLDEHECPRDLVCCKTSDESANSVEPSPCNGACVPFFQCSNGKLNTAGKDLINLRYSEETCSGDLVCCQYPEMVKPISVPNICEGKCVPFFQCPNGLQNAAGKDLINLRSFDDACSDDLVCCSDSPMKSTNVGSQQTCQCVPFYQCLDEVGSTVGKDLINLRFAQFSCPGDQICCRNPRTTNQEQTSGIEPYKDSFKPDIFIPRVCDGNCVPFLQCPNGSPNTAGKGLLNLRSFDDTCPGDLVCCSNSRSKNEEKVPGVSEAICKGSCVPFGQCQSGTYNTAGQGLLNLRSFDDCPNDFVCCERMAKPEIQVPRVCEGKCVPFFQCPTGTPNTGGKDLLNLRSFDDTCPEDLVCCSNPQSTNELQTSIAKTVCKGSCVPFYQCQNGTYNTAGQGVLNLRSYDDCPNDLVCCEAKPTNEVPKDCDGKCVPFFQCPTGLPNTGGKDLLNLRSFDGTCPGDLVCCSNPQPSNLKNSSIAKYNCRGTCVPFAQCSNGTYNTSGKDILNLRNFDDCPKDLVCCEDLVRPEVLVPRVCEGKCVPFFQCPSGSPNIGGKDLLNLRSFDDACPEDLVCCAYPQSTVQTSITKTECKGACVPFYQCQNGSHNTAEQGLLNLRSNDDCPNDLVCCEGLMPIIPSTKVCQGKCVPFFQCPAESPNTGGKELLNLRSFDGTCPEDLVCCSNPRSTVQTSVTSKTECKGSCVPFYQCQNGIPNTAGQGLLNLRSYDDCPNDLVCCEGLTPQIQPPVVCNGKCVPFYQCPTGSPNTGGKDLLNLRSFDDSCSGDLVCCSNPRPRSQDQKESVSKTGCKGTCVPFYQCHNGTHNTAGHGLLNLRNFDDCPNDLVCCEVLRKPAIQSVDQICSGKCVPSNKCFDKNTVDLRLYGGGCPPQLVCCQTLYPDMSDKPVTEQQNPLICQGTCVPPAHCNDAPVEFNLDLRTQPAINGCQRHLVCCMNPSNMQNVQHMWTQWITDINNMVDDGFGGQPAGCSMKIDPDVEYVLEKEIPWLVTVWSRQATRGNTRDEYLCVGTRIRSDVLLVPADCVKDLPQSRLFIRIGDYNFKSAGDNNELEIKKVVLHPDFTSSGNHNVGLIFLAVKRNNNLPVACLFERDEPRHEHDCFLIGWNSLDQSSGTDSSALPKKHRLQVLSSPSCRQGYLCTGRSQSSINCDGFHGSPLICLDPSGGHWKQAGLVVANNDRCDFSGIPNSLLDVSQLQPWIKEQLTPSFVQKPGVLEPSRRYLPTV